jgi:uncharacterized protein with PQ loop repeat
VIQLIGYLGSLGAAVMWMPQVARAVRHRHDFEVLAGISLASYLIAVVFNALLVTYGALNHADPVALAGCVNLLCATVIVVVVARSRRLEI